MRYIAKVNVTHGQGRGDTKQEWKISTGMTFDPEEAGMSKETVESLLKWKKIALHDGGDAPAARAVPAPTPDYVNRIHAKAAAKAAVFVAATTPSE